MKYLNLLLIVTCFSVFSCKTDSKEGNNQTSEADNSELVAENSDKEKVLDIHPISHATMVLSYGDIDIYVDPTGGAKAFASFSKPDFVIITDIHGDHLNLETLKALDLSDATIIGPKAVIGKLPEDLKAKVHMTINNGDSATLNGFDVEAIPMYNLREEALQFHTKGRGNGYVLTIGNERIYISGDTEDIPEMRALENIDKAFVCMNLPWTMTVDKAAEAVLEFKPKAVYPYHYRGKDGMSDVSKFKTLINQGDEDIDVVQLDWYN
ncbi:MBL fold metallo-hydrolase [Psychroserpens luteolus]|uniref:MBL fold metallo-hydrolase n=1 Tax=Psychroserpens luteolus TaxID=2855840 RepID=UPI001E2C847F|nr:MBL fold metallo-hydrolase [Psychroserpens luteolus]MCD2259062.1 MBL fold metallo-hydrolase [Psychroserpens luteolus]